ncbi:aminoglycoside phosphotransferase family protein [Nonomuraea sp. NN258]|uniref:aminoglycoside phosphotransferase family protein n=1 Tax=Nonomuraea antri TaxID=2730852 RepID=UPI0015685559|nr:aminoglycoside phosphotransferase family protein [Nonomuraea antri]NRQ40674.1 aminoglycoside phosphotransferase family protein [Nonomuraea antri]
MTLGKSHIHDIDLRDDVVIKRYRSWARREPHREWAALSLVATHVPGLAPVPLRARLDGVPPWIMMTRLPGLPLDGRHVTSDQVAAVADALTLLHRAVPADAVQELRPAVWTPSAAVTRARTWAERNPDPGGDDPLVAEAFARGREWLTGPVPDRLTAGPAAPVLGLADGDVSNYLWNPITGQAHVIDWEHAGRSDRAFELAEVAEHISHADGDRFLSHLTLSSAEAARVRDFRILLAVSWLLMLGPQGPCPARAGTGELERQAGRVLALLGHEPAAKPRRRVFTLARPYLGWLS